MGEDKEAEIEMVMQIILGKKKKCLKRRLTVRNSEWCYDSGKSKVDQKEYAQINELFLAINLLSSGGGKGQVKCLEDPHGQRSLVGYAPWGHKESDTTEYIRGPGYFILKFGFCFVLKI